MIDNINSNKDSRIGTIVGRITIETIAMYKSVCKLIETKPIVEIFIQFEGYELEDENEGKLF